MHIHWSRYVWLRQISLTPFFSTSGPLVFLIFLRGSLFWNWTYMDLDLTAFLRTHFPYVPRSFPSSAHQTCSFLSCCTVGPWGCSSQQFCLLQYGRTSCLSDCPRWCHGLISSPLPQHSTLQERYPKTTINIAGTSLNVCFQQMPLSS